MTAPAQTAAEIAAITNALTDYDKAVAQCPVRRNRRWDSRKPCTRCNAIDNEGCGLDAGASSQFVAAVRAALATPDAMEEGR